MLEKMLVASLSCVASLAEAAALVSPKDVVIYGATPAGIAAARSLRRP